MDDSLVRKDANVNSQVASKRAQLEGLLEDTFAGNGGGDNKAEIPSIRVTVPEEQGIWDHERSVKLADHGTGFLEQEELMELVLESAKHETC
ncbi:unnamed protein product [Cladocopium goreaui]|uniref:[Pyruvate dehydrogenase (Acetyl-transferring)] kinase isozyme 4, mitochondrial n=1 Tax=Cladocopium goreaui TaxID=2562237 RepID=A0A9P1GNG2_9DINO|nr:unnamed protein product [Cladocopium goreaui]